VAGALLSGTIRAGSRAGSPDLSALPSPLDVTTEASATTPVLAEPRPGWWTLTFVAAALLTAFDGFLIQQKKSFFTGGFLAADHATGLQDVLGFAIASLASDAAVAGLLIAIGLRAFARTMLTSLARSLAVMSLALTPLVISDFADYRLLTYLGDAFDVSLMFDLTGRRAEEILAIAMPHLIVPAFMVVGLGTITGGLIWAVNRINPGSASHIRVRSRIYIAAVAFFGATVVATTAVRASSDMMENGLRRKPSGGLLAFVVEFVSDVDRDGYGIGGYMPDPAPFDPAIYPHAPDLPGNGLDEDGVGGDLPGGTPPYIERRILPPLWQTKPNVVLIVLESFRADAVGSTVNGKPVTPSLDGLAAKGISARAAYSHNGYTTQSRFHIMSGSLASLRRDGTLVDDFKANGYEVGYFSGQDESFESAQFDVGFDRADVAYDARQDKHRRYSTFTTPGSLAVPYQTVQERVADFMARRDAGRPLFVYINFHDTHYPYHHGGIQPLVSSAPLPEAKINPARAAELRETYLNTAANVDRAIGATLRTIMQHLASPPAIIVTADHGESLFDEGFLGHGYALNDAQTRIPLIVTGLPVTIYEPFGQIDLRDAISAALTGGATDAPPEIRTGTRKAVFQYLGNFNRPRQIAFQTESSRVIYDFRTRLVGVGSGAWQRPEVLPKDTLGAFRQLIHFWERMVLARGTRRGLAE
jgi:hypothetical protein